MSGNSLRVELGERSYDIVVDAGALGRLGELVKPVLPSPRVVIITDSDVAPLYLEKVQSSLQAAGIHPDALVIPAGEASKSFSQFSKLLDDILALGIDRKVTLLALGGGVIGDITGFAAAVTLRGLPFIQVPTSLLAQVDSSVGGKTGINARAGKNLVGAFHQPELVVIDTDTLDTLPKRELLAGYAEVVKYGLLGDAEFFDWLETNGPALVDGDAALRQEAILHCCAAKADVVARDERESGVRALLNLGHTFGHALEAEVGYGGGLLHGEAVAMGMVMAFDYSVRAGLCSPEDASRVRAHLTKAGLPMSLENLSGGTWTADALMVHMLKDKKVLEGRLTFILARAIGDSFITSDVDGADVHAYMHEILSTDL